MEQMEQKNTGYGNTNITRKSLKARNYFFTWNNYTKDDLHNLEQYMMEQNYVYMIGKEVGAQGTPHLQGCFKLMNPRSWNSVMEEFHKFGTHMHLEKCKNWARSVMYCMKEANYTTNIKDVKPFLREMGLLATIIEERALKRYDGVQWKDWQTKLLEIIETESDDRTINWVFDLEGCTGKSFLAKYLVLKYDAIIASGVKADIFNQIKIWIEKWESSKDPVLIILDIPRSFEHVNYGVLEEIKNGMIYSGKYEGGRCIFKSPHVIVFSNALPDTGKWSSDRLNIITL